MLTVQSYGYFSPAALLDFSAPSYFCNTSFISVFSLLVDFGTARPYFFSYISSHRLLHLVFLSSLPLECRHLAGSVLQPSPPSLFFLPGSLLPLHGSTFDNIFTLMSLTPS